MRIPSVLYGSLTIAAVGLFVACSDLSTKPSPLSASDFTRSIEVIGPDSLKAGQSAQFVANIHQSDGTTKSVTSMQNLRWRSSNTSVMSVSNSGMVTAWSSASGEAVISADIAPDGAVQGTRQVAIRPKAVVNATVEVSQSGTEPDQVFYVFAVKLTESAGVPATVTALEIAFDAGWGGGCVWTADKLGQTRLPANGTLELGPLTCDDSHRKASGVEVDINLTDDSGYVIVIGNELVPPASRAAVGRSYRRGPEPGALGVAAGEGGDRGLSSECKTANGISALVISQQGTPGQITYAFKRVRRLISMLPPSTSC